MIPVTDPDRSKEFYELRIYPDAAHGFLFQYPTEVAVEVTAFLKT